MKGLVGKCVVKTTKTNVFINLQTDKGLVVKELSAGNLGMNGVRKRTVFCAESLGRTIAKEALLKNYRRIEVTVKGLLDKNLKAVIMGLGYGGIRITKIIVLNIEAHNGVRLRKARK